MKNYKNILEFNQRRKTMKKPLLLLFVGIIFIAGASKSARAQAPLPIYIADAFKKAALPADEKGEWVVSANVQITKPSGEILEGNGALALAGNDVLAGNLGLKVKGGAYIPKNSMWLIISKEAGPLVVMLRHDIGGKPYLGRPAVQAKLKNLYTAPFSMGTIMWNSEDSQVHITLSPEQRIAATGPPSIRKPPPTPIGARYKMTGRVVFTNTEDGFADNTCETSGNVNLVRNSYGSGSRVTAFIQLFDFISQDVTAVANFPFSKVIDVYDEDKSQFRLAGYFSDTDDFKTETMWPDPNEPRRSVNLKKTEEQVYPGDRDSENAEVYITVTKISDLYKREPTKTVWNQ